MFERAKIKTNQNIYSPYIGRKKRKEKYRQKKHRRTHTWTIVSDVKAVVNKVKKRNYNDYTESDNIVPRHICVLSDIIVRNSTSL